MNRVVEGKLLTPNSSCLSLCSPGHFTVEGPLLQVSAMSHSVTFCLSVGSMGRRLKEESLMVEDGVQGAGSQEALLLVPSLKSV